MIELFFSLVGLVGMVMTFVLILAGHDLDSSCKHPDCGGEDFSHHTFAGPHGVVGSYRVCKKCGRVS